VDIAFDRWENDCINDPVRSRLPKESYSGRDTSYIRATLFVIVLRSAGERGEREQIGEWYCYVDGQLGFVACRSDGLVD